VYHPTSDLPGILELKGNRLRISFANTDHGTGQTHLMRALHARLPHWFGGSELQWLSGFVLVTVLDPSGKRAAGASLFSFESFMCRVKKQRRQVASRSGQADGSGI